MTESPMFDLPEEQPARRSRRSQQQDEQLFVDQMMYMLTAPRVFYPPWDTLADLHKSDVTMHRLLGHKEILEKEMCSEFEAMLYLSSASMESPMRHDWVEIYFWLFNRWKPEAAQANDIPMPTLENTQVESLNRLRRWIFRTQMNRIKSQRASADQEEVAKEQQELEAQQPRMFDIEEGE